MQTQKSRTKAAVINSLSATIFQVLGMIMSFVVRSMFIKILGAQYLGLNGLFLNILSILSFSELGIGFAITYSLYRPVAEQDQGQVSALIHLYGKIYKIIALIILGGGLSVLPFLRLLIHGNINSLGNIYIAFALFLLNSVVSYLWSYKRSIFIADQANYVNTINTFIFQFVAQVIQIIFLILHPSYYIYLIIQICLTLSSNVAISRLADKRYPYLKEKNATKVFPETIAYLKKNVIGMMSGKLGGVVVTGTDNILLSMFVGLSAVGGYSNYTLIITGLTTILNQAISAVTASIGNLNVTATKEKQTTIFYKYSYISSVIGFAVSVGLVAFFQPFIGIWVGTRYVLSPMITWLIVVVFFVTQLRQPTINFTNAYGLYWEQRYKPIFEAGLNLAVSLILIRYTHLGIASVLIGTLLSNLLVNSWWEPWIVMRYGLKSNLKDYFKLYFIQLIFGLILITISQVVSYNAFILNSNFFVSIVVTAIIVVIVSTLFAIIVGRFGMPRSEKKINILDTMKMMRR